MPAAPSSLVDPAISQFLAAARSLGQERAHLLSALAVVPDPRARRGVRHRLAVILGLAVCAVLAAPGPSRRSGNGPPMLIRAPEMRLGSPA